VVFVDNIVALGEIGVGLDALPVRRELPARFGGLAARAHKLGVREYRKAQGRVLKARRHRADRDAALSGLGHAL